MTRKEAKEIFDKSSDNAISYHDSTEVISIASAEIIIDKIYEDFEKQLESIQKELEELIAKDKSKNCEECYDKTMLAIEALENRSCNNCKHWELGWCFKLGSSLDIGGCGDYWELKC